MKFRNKLAALALAGVLLGGGAVAVAAPPAEAHTGGVTGSSVCETDGTYTVTWTYTAANVPDGVEAETKAMTTSVGKLSPLDGVDKGGQIFLSVWAEHQVNVPGAPVKTGNWSAQFKTVGIPGSTTEVTTMVQTDWHHGPSEDPVGKVVLDGKCTTLPADVVVTPTAPTWMDDCGPGNGYWSYTDTAEYSYNALPTGEIILTPKPGYTFPPGTTTWWQATDSNELCPPGPANPQAVIVADCGTATVTLTNPGENILTASYVVNVDGKFYKAYSAPAGETKTVTIPFGEDTGTHRIEVFQAGTSEWKSIASVDVTSDCLPPVVPPTEEPPVEEPPAVEPPLPPVTPELPPVVVETPTCDEVSFEEAQSYPALDADGDGIACETSVEQKALAATGGFDVAPLLWTGAFVLVAGAVLLVYRKLSSK